MYTKMKKCLFYGMVLMTFGLPLGATEKTPVPYGPDNQVVYKTNDTHRIEVISVTDSNNDGNVGSNVNDGDLDTRWSSKDENPYIVLTLRQEAQMEAVMLASFVGDTRLAYYDIEVSTDGINWTLIDSYETSGQTTDLEAFTVNGDVVSHVKIIGGGNSINNWSSITEIEIMGVPYSGEDTNSNDGNSPVDDGSGDEPADGIPGENINAGGNESGGCFIDSMQLL